ncbi:hypothetical protein D3C81_727560 [compost metagenome]
MLLPPIRTGIENIAGINYTTIKQQPRLRSSPDTVARQLQGHLMTSAKAEV